MVVRVVSNEKFILRINISTNRVTVISIWMVAFCLCHRFYGCQFNGILFCSPAGNRIAWAIWSGISMWMVITYLLIWDNFTCSLGKGQSNLSLPSVHSLPSQSCPTRWNCPPADCRSGRVRPSAPLREAAHAYRPVLESKRWHGQLRPHRRRWRPRWSR